MRCASYTIACEVDALGFPNHAPYPQDAVAVVGCLSSRNAFSPRWCDNRNTIKARQQQRQRNSAFRKVLDTPAERRRKIEEKMSGSVGRKGLGSLGDWTGGKAKDPIRERQGKDGRLKMPAAI